MVNMNRRQFFKVTGASLASSSMVLLGAAPTPAMAEVRQYKLTRMTETRNTCPYCSVACGVLLYSRGDGAMNAEPSVVHIEGDADHPVNRGTLCPKGASLIDFIHSPNRLKEPEYRAPGGTEWQKISWNDALDRIARLWEAIGAADGFDDVQRGQADLLLSFGRATWPHLMARAMLAEQLWRASSILANHPYHREG